MIFVCLCACTLLHNAPLHCNLKSCVIYVSRSCGVKDKLFFLCYMTAQHCVTAQTGLFPRRSLIKKKLHFYIYSRWQTRPCMKIQWDAINKQYKYDALPHDTLEHTISAESLCWHLQHWIYSSFPRPCLSCSPGSVLALSSSDNWPTLLSANKNEK